MANNIDDDYSNRKMSQLASLIDENLPGGVGQYGFCLFVFGLDKPETCNYISNCNRSTTAKAIKEWLERFEHQTL